MDTCARLQACSVITCTTYTQNTFFDKYPMTLEANNPWLWRQISHGNGDKYPLKTTGFEKLHVFYCKSNATNAYAPHLLKIHPFLTITLSFKTREKVNHDDLWLCTAWLWYAPSLIGIWTFVHSQDHQMNRITKNEHQMEHRSLAMNNFETIICK